MGFYSFKTSDTKESVSNAYSSKGALSVKMIDNKGNEYIEENYQGYGVFDNKDYYELVSDMNPNLLLKLKEKYPTLDMDNLSDKDKGATLCFDDKLQPLLPKIVSINCEVEYDRLSDSKNCPNQGYFYNDLLFL
jgi:hypothetical protein